MTTEKVQSKIKSSTIAITVLSILLALAVASTIVLAAFSANKSASTTITFGGGLTLTLSSATSTDFGSAGVDSGDTFIITPTNTAFAGAVEVPAISGTLNMNGFVGFKVFAFHYESEGTPQWSAATAITNTETTVGQVKVKVTAGDDVTYDTEKGIYYTDTVKTSDDNPLALITKISITADDYNLVKGDKVEIAIVFYAESENGNGSAANIKAHDYGTPSHSA